MRKKQIVMILGILTFSSCKVSKNQNQEDNFRDKEKQEWIFAFKSSVFYECVKHSGVKIEKDASPSLNFEVLGDFKILSKTDLIGKSYSKIIEDRSAWLKDGDLDGYKAITNGCLSFFASRELDSIANVEFERSR